MVKEMILWEEYRAAHIRRYNPSRLIRYAIRLEMFLVKLMGSFGRERCY